MNAIVTITAVIIFNETQGQLQFLCIQFQAQAPLPLLFKIDMGQLTEHEAPVVKLWIATCLLLLNQS